MKKLLLFILVFCLCLSLCACNNAPIDHGELIAYGDCDDNIKWKIYADGFLSITGKGKMKDNPWTEYSEYIKTVDIKNGILSIAEGAFADCTNIETVKVSADILEIPKSAFKGCLSLTSVELPSTVTSIGPSAFENCTSLENIMLPDALSYIGASAFAECDSIINITLPNGVTDIAEYCFKGCDSLESVTLPNAITTISDFTFYECPSLLTINFPDSLIEIGASAFRDCTSLDKITFPDSLEGLGDSAFSNCKSLQAITIPSKVTHINLSVFSECDSLEKVSILGQVETIEDFAFYSCHIQEIHLPGSIKTVYPRAFIGGYTVKTVYWSGDPMPEFTYPYLGHSQGKQVWKYDRTCKLIDLFEKANVIIEYNGVQIDASINFGRYEQDNNISNGMEDIEWLVLEIKDGKALIVSKYALDCQSYHSSDVDITWEESSLRDWLNDEFIDLAFNSQEQTLISTEKVSADKNSYFNSSPGNITQDRVFLLSMAEVSKYFHSKEGSVCKPTDYAVAQGVFIDSSNGNCPWWLRTPGEMQNYAAIVNCIGGIGGGLSVANNTNAIRPALWIEISNNS